MPKNIPRFQQHLFRNDTAETISHSFQKGIRSFYMPIKHDMQFPLVTAMVEENLEREDIYVSISCVDTIVTKIEVRASTLIYMDMAVWQIPKNVPANQSFKQWLLSSWRNMDTIIKNRISYRLGIYFDNYSLEESKNILGQILYFCQINQLTKPSALYTTNPEHILKLKEFTNDHDIKLYIHLAEDRESTIPDDTGLSPIVIQNTFYFNNNIGILANTNNNDIIG
jgi:hypothetical protein